MEQLRRIMAGIGAQLKGLNASHKLVIASVGLLLIAVMLVVAQWTGKPDLVEVLPASTPAEQQKAESYLGSAGFKLEKQGGKLMVASADAIRARAMLAESGQMPNDKTLLFENLIKANSWTNSRQQNDMNYLNALMNELALTISHFHGIKSAKVIIDIPEQVGLGAAVRRPTASSTVWTSTGEAMPQSMVDAVANFIAGSRAGLDVTRVRVIDGNTGRQRKATSEDDALSTTYLEQAQRVEALTREKVQELLAYIPGVIVAVTAQVDVTKVTSKTDSFLKEGEGSISMEKKSSDTQNRSNEGGPGGEAGVASNAQADINRGSGSGSKTEQTENITENEVHAGTKTETVIDPKGHPTMVAVTVNVPKSFVASVMPAGAAGAAAPDEAALRKEFENVKKGIIEQIRPQVRAMTVSANSKVDAKAIEAIVDQSIGVSLIPDMPKVAGVQQAGLLTALGGGGGGGGSLGLGSGLVEKGVLGVLGLTAMGMMVVMVKKAGKKTEIPTAEELVGLPPALETQADVIGEADESDTAMEGIEVGDDQMQGQKMLEQVSELVGSNPEAAAKLVSRWIEVEE